MKDINELRSMLSDELDRLVNDKSTPAKSHAVSSLTGRIFASYKLEMSYYKMTGKIPSMTGLFVVQDEKIPALAEK